jgi:hypothetical protein
MPRELVETISLNEANALLAGHYLGASRFATSYCLAALDHSAVAVFRPPIPPQWNAVVNGLELSRLWRDEARTAPLSAFVSASMRWLRRNAPAVDCCFALSDTETRNSVTRRFHLGGVYNAANFAFIGETRPEPHWIDADGSRINRQSVYRLLGTTARDKVAAARPSLQYVAGEPKRLFCFPLALSVAAVLDRLNGIPRAAGSRPFALAARPHLEPWD